MHCAVVYTHPGSLKVQCTCNSRESGRRPLFPGGGGEYGIASPYLRYVIVHAAITRTCTEGLTEIALEGMGIELRSVTGVPLQVCQLKVHVHACTYTLYMYRSTTCALVMEGQTIVWEVVMQWLVHWYSSH